MAVAPEAGGPAAAGVLLTLSLLAFLAWLLCRMLLAGWNVSLGYLLDKLASILNFHHVGIHVDFGGPIRALNGEIRGWLSNAAAATEGAAGTLFHYSANVWHWTVRETTALAEDTYAFGNWLINKWIPHYVGIWTQGLGDLKHLLSRLAPRVEKIYVQVPRVAKAAANAAAKTVVPSIAIPYAGEWEWIHKHWKALTGAVAAAGALAFPGTLGIPWLRKEVFGLTKRNLSIFKRLRRAEALFGAAAMAAAMANALGLSSWRCITRGNIGRVSRALCGLSAGALQDLLGLLVDLFVLANVCEVITLMTDAFALIETPLVSWIETAADQFVHCNYDLPGRLPDPALSTPPVTGVVLSLPS